MMYRKQQGDYYVTIYNGSNKNSRKKVNLFEYDPSTNYFKGDSKSTSVVSIQSTGSMTEMAISIINYFISLGFTPQSSAGIVGNSYQESGLNPRCEGTVKGVGKTLGLFQFEPGAGMTRENYLSWAGQENAYNPTKQCEYVVTMLPQAFKLRTGPGKWGHYKFNGGEQYGWQEKMTLDDFKKLTDPALAAEIFCRVYERPSISRMSKRTSAALKYYEEWKKSKG